MMAVDERILRRLIPALFECLLLLHTLGYMRSIKGDCVSYGVCGREAGKVSYCVYNGPAKPVPEETKYFLDKYCPQFSSGPVCCDNDQLNKLKSNITLVERLLAQCPSCSYNFIQHICGMACSPDQSDFIKPIIVQGVNSTHQRVLEIDYYLSATYKEATFKSCQNVPLFGTPKTAFSLICGAYGEENCTADRLFQFFGSVDANPFFLFQINYKGRDDDFLNRFTPHKPPTTERGCNETEQDHQPITSKGKDSAITTDNDDLITANKIKQNPTDKETDKTGCCKYNCELLYKQEQKKLQVQEDYYSFKKDYLRDKLVLLREQTEAFKMIAKKMTWTH